MARNNIIRTLFKRLHNGILIEHRLFILRPYRRGFSSSKFGMDSDESQHHQQKIMYTFNKMYLGREIDELEKKANQQPQNVDAQLKLYEILVDIDPEYVTKRFESRQYAFDDRCLHIYRKAVENLREENAFNKTPFTQKFGKRNFRFGNIFLRALPFAIIIYFFVLPNLNIDDKNKKIPISLTSMLGDRREFEEVRPEKIKIRFLDVRGTQEAKDELLELVDFLQNPSKYKEIGCRISSGVLMVGPPGTGKTMLAKAIAGEAQVPFFYASGSEFDEMFVGVGASRMRRLFAKARENAPCIVFIDELDAVGGKRMDSPLSPHSRMTINQLLTELDGFKENNIVVIGATNDPGVLDSALTRAGRFDTTIEVPLPSYRDRIDILDYYINKVSHSSDVKIERLASLTPGASGADLSNLVNQAAVRAVTRRSNLVTMEDIEWARDKIMMGRERKSVIFTENEKKRIADHEAGHAIVAYYTKYSRKLHKATIIPRGYALGVTHLLPERDEILLSYDELLARIDVSMGGRAAEELIYGIGQVTTGCSSDLQSGTAIAREMVSEFGYSKKFGLNSMKALKKSQSSSPELDSKVQEEVKRILEESYQRAFDLLKLKKSEHRRLSDALLLHETLDETQINEILG